MTAPSNRSPDDWYRLAIVEDYVLCGVLLPVGPSESPFTLFRLSGGDSVLSRHDVDDLVNAAREDPMWQKVWLASRLVGLVQFASLLEAPFPDGIWFSHAVATIVEACRLVADSPARDRLASSVMREVEKHLADPRVVRRSVETFCWKRLPQMPAGPPRRQVIQRREFPVGRPVPLTAQGHFEVTYCGRAFAEFATVNQANLAREVLDLALVIDGVTRGYKVNDEPK